MRTKRQQRASLLDHYSRQVGLLVSRRQTELGLSIARREAERAAEHARYAMLTAEAANRAKTQFLANMSHELRTPLNAIIGFAEVIVGKLVAESNGEKIREYATDIHSSGRHLLNVINDILDIARIEAGSLDLKEEWVDVRPLVEMPLDICRPRIAENALSLTVELEAGLPDLCCDGRLVRQILINLISNAAKFTPQGGSITVAVRREQDLSLSMSVADTGIGIAAEHIADALAPFRQVDNELGRRYDGTGLGLPLSKAFIELHGGSLSLESEPGKGTTVTVRFPKNRLRDTAAPATGEAATPPPPAPASSVACAAGSFPTNQPRAARISA
jgi:signal transduction histidine kinase